MPVKRTLVANLPMRVATHPLSGADPGPAAVARHAQLGQLGVAGRRAADAAVQRTRGQRLDRAARPFEVELHPARSAEARAQPAAGSGRQRSCASVRAGSSAPPRTGRANGALRPRARRARGIGSGSRSPGRVRRRAPRAARLGVGAGRRRASRLRVSRSEEITNTGLPGGGRRGRPADLPSVRLAAPPPAKSRIMVPLGRGHL